MTGIYDGKYAANMDSYGGSTQRENILWKMYNGYITEYCILSLTPRPSLKKKSNRKRLAFGIPKTTFLFGYQTQVSI
jgi:hypothetical protein